MSLYRIHRPQLWDSLVAQDHVKITLMQELKSNTVAHAFLFTGPRGVGKTTTARLLAKSLQCDTRVGENIEPCNECESCVSITKGSSVDVIEIDAASHTGVDNVRENIIENARFAPTRCKYKVFIIDEVHMLSGHAFNALLKTIEEPPSHVKFIMATTELHKVPATIISRCQRFDFRHISIADMKTRLASVAKKEGFEIDDAVLAHIAWRAGGSLRDAESVLGQVLSLGEKKITVEIAGRVLPSRATSELLDYCVATLSNDPTTACQVIINIVHQGANLPHFTDDLIDTMRAMLLIKTTGGHGDSYFPDEDLTRLSQCAETNDLSKILRFLEILLKRRMEIGSSPILHLPLELAAIEMSASSDVAIHPPKKTNGPLTTAPRPSIIASENTPIIQTQKKTDPPVNGPLPTLEIIMAQWPQFLEHLHTYNHSLPFILKTCTPTRMEGTTLVITLPYAFHKKRLEEPKVSDLLSKALADIYQTTLYVTAEVDESKATATDEAVARVLETFGGQVVG